MRLSSKSTRASLSSERQYKTTSRPSTSYGADLAGLDEFFQLIVPHFQPAGDADNGDRRGDRFARAIDNHDLGFGRSPFINPLVAQADFEVHFALLR